MTICFTAIVKDEADNIKDLASNILPHIDCWSIIDTGSTDNTKDLVDKYFGDKPGELHERSWVNTGHNLTEAVQLADSKADYMLVLDADDRLRGKLPPLADDFYRFEIHLGANRFWRSHLFRSGLNWRYIGPCHVFPASDLAKTQGTVTDGYIEARATGPIGGDPEKYKRDAELLEQAIKEDPKNLRYWFYLAQSYHDYGDYAKARPAYLRRVRMGGWIEERFFSQWRAGRCGIILNEHPSVVVHDLLTAYEILPTRAESLYTLVVYLLSRRRFALAEIFVAQAKQIEQPRDGLFVCGDIYDAIAKWE